MKKIILLVIIVLILTTCKKSMKCPDYASGGCGCYNTGQTSTPYTPTHWNSSQGKCFYTDQLGNDIEIDKKYCPCQ